MKFRDLLKIYEHLKEEEDRLAEKLMAARQALDFLEHEIRDTADIEEANRFERERAETEAARRDLWKEQHRLTCMMEKIEDAELR